MEAKRLEEVSRAAFHAHETARLDGATSFKPFRDWDTLPEQTKVGFRAAVAVAIELSAPDAAIPKVDFKNHAGQHRLERGPA